MTDDEIDKFRAAERERMKPMREAMQKEAFVQGWMVGKFSDPSKVSDDVLLAALPAADEAYVTFARNRNLEMAVQSTRYERAKEYVRKAFGDDVDFAPGTSGHAMARVVELELGNLDELRAKITALADSMTIR